MAGKGEKTSCNYWGKAYCHLRPKTQGKINSILQQRGQHPQEDLTWPERLQKSCEESREKQQKENWVITLGGKTVSLHNLWDKTIDALAKVKNIGTVATSTEPMANLGWSVAQLLIEVPIQKKKVAESIVQSLSKVVLLMARGHIYEYEIQMTWKNEDDAGFQNFRALLVSLYTEILNFLADASDYCEGSGFSRTFKATWDSSSITSFDENTTQIQSDLQEQASQRFRVGAHTDLEIALEYLRGLENREQDKKTDEERKSVLSWLSAYQYASKHNVLHRSRVKKTGDWIVRHRKFKTWIGSVEQNMLWIHGIPGAGKTYLISRIVDYFMSKNPPEAAGGSSNVLDWKDPSVAYFYCRRDESESRNCVSILRCLTKQLLPKSKPLPREVLKVYEEKAPIDAADRDVSVQECREMMNAVFSRHRRVLIILDALDECHDDAIETLVNILPEIVSQQQSSSHVKVVFSSRETDLIRRLTYKSSIKITAEENQEDISWFVDAWLAESRPQKLPEGLKSKIKSIIVEQSEAKFQLAARRLIDISNKLTYDISENLTNKEVEEALDQSSAHTLDDEYRKAMESIRSNQSIGKNVIQALSWVRGRGGSSPSNLLIAAIIQEQGVNEVVDTQSERLGNLIDSCQFLLTVDDDSVVRFSHLSVMEYLDLHGQEHGLDATFVPTVHLKTLLKHVRLPRRDTPLDSRPRDKIGLLYQDAIANWWQYISPLGSEYPASLESLLQQFLGNDPPSLACRHWLGYVAKNMAEVISRPVSQYEKQSVTSSIFCPSEWISYHHDMDASSHLQSYLGLFQSLRKFSTRRREHRPLEMRAEFRLHILEPVIAGCLVRVKSTLALSYDFHEWKSLSQALENQNDAVPQEPTTDHPPQENTREECSQLTDDAKEISMSQSLPSQAAVWLYHMLAKLSSLLIWLLISLIEHLDPSLKVISTVEYRGDFVESKNEVAREDQMPDSPAEESNQEEGSTKQEHQLPSVERNLNRQIMELTQLKNMFTDFLVSIKAHDMSTLKKFFEEPRPQLPRYTEELARIVMIMVCLWDNSLPWQGNILPVLRRILEKTDTSKPFEYEYINVSVQDLDRWKPMLVTNFWSNKDQEECWPMLLKLIISSGADANFEITDRSLYSWHLDIFDQRKWNKLFDGPSTPLIASVTWYDKGGAEILPCLIQNGANINQEASKGEYGTAMIAACALGHVGAVNQILETGQANINHCVSTGRFGTALIAACVSKRVNIMGQLLRKGARTGVTTNYGKHRTVWDAILATGNPAAAASIKAHCDETHEITDTDVPSTLEQACHKWPFFSHKVWTPMRVEEPGYDEARREELTAAVQQLGVALLYHMIDLNLDWADHCKREAILCLSFLSNSGSWDERQAAMIVVDSFGLAGMSKSDLDVLQEFFRRIQKDYESKGWEAVASEFTAKLLSFVQ